MLWTTSGYVFNAFSLFTISYANKEFNLSQFKEFDRLQFLFNKPDNMNCLTTVPFKHAVMLQ